MTLKEKILKLAEETAENLDKCPRDLQHTSELARLNGRLKVLNELMLFMIENKI